MAFKPTITLSDEVARFGDAKHSGLGRESQIYGIDEYRELKYLSWEGASSRE